MNEIPKFQKIRQKLRELGRLKELRDRRKTLVEEGKKPREIRDILTEEFESVLD